MPSGFEALWKSKSSILDEAKQILKDIYGDFLVSARRDFKSLMKNQHTYMPFLNIGWDSTNIPVP